MKPRIDLISIVTSKFSEMLLFYKDVMGFAVQLELAFPVSSPSEVDATYKELIQKGATPIKEPADMPWHQRAAFLADPDGNIHEIFAKL